MAAKARPSIAPGTPRAYRVLTKTDRPKVLAAREQRPYPAATLAADHPGMTSTATPLRLPERPGREGRNGPGPAPGRGHQPLAGELVGAGVGGRGGSPARGAAAAGPCLPPAVAAGVAVACPGMPPTSPDLYADRVAYGNALIRTAVDQAVGWLPGDVAMEQQAFSGRPAVELANLGWGGDLVVLGSRRRGWLRRLAPGSVARACARRADCPVVIVPEPSPSVLQASLPPARPASPGSGGCRGAERGRLRDDLPRRIRNTHSGMP
jgi:nucleotide-binding universal stress UspA family protein